MKKVLVVLGVVLFSASAFALNAVAPEEESCASQKVAFEKYAVAQANDSFIAQHILINMADPMEKQSDAQAMAQAVCYSTFQVRGQRLVEFVRAHADFPGDISGREAAKMRNFADRVERLSIQGQLNAVADQENISHIVQFILINFADPMVKMSDYEAASLAKAYKGCHVNGQPMLEFVQAHANDFAGKVPQELNAFVQRVNKLAK